MPSEGLIKRLDEQVSRRKMPDIDLANKHAFALFRHHYVVRVDDGRDTQEIVFDEPPTLAELAAYTSEEAWIVSVRTRRSFRRWISIRFGKASKGTIRAKQSLDGYEDTLATFRPPSVVQSRKAQSQRLG